MSVTRWVPRTSIQYDKRDSFRGQATLLTAQMPQGQFGLEMYLHGRVLAWQSLSPWV